MLSKIINRFIFCDLSYLHNPLSLSEDRVWWQDFEEAYFVAALLS
jgi:hypothetical protein